MSKSIYQDLLTGYRETLLPTKSTKKQLNEGFSITVDNEDAEDLLQLLAMAGLSHNTAPVEVDVMDEPLDENQPNWPTRPETMQDTPTLSNYSGGLNGPKSTGQSTIPVLASQMKRQKSSSELGESAELMNLERSLFKLYQNYKAE